MHSFYDIQVVAQYLLYCSYYKARVIINDDVCGCYNSNDMFLFKLHFSNNYIVGVGIIKYS